MSPSLTAVAWLFLASLPRSNTGLQHQLICVQRPNDPHVMMLRAAYDTVPFPTEEEQELTRLLGLSQSHRQSVKSGTAALG